MKRLQVVVKAIYAIEVPEDFDYTDIAEVQNQIEEYFGTNNMTAHNEFYENMKVVCADCGISLSNEEEEEDGKCASCGAKQNDTN